ncbi:MAG: pyocin activator PrtN family protein, partial [Desulfuromonadaceae bacterium]|nr:pyocin activator PrtN family protein [Desulfuromonadaceae bacterium]
MTTIEQLKKRYTCNHIELSEFRADYMPHINNEVHLLRILRAHPQPLSVSKLHASKRAPYIIYLYDLA